MKKTLSKGASESQIVVPPTPEHRQSLTEAKLKRLVVKAGMHGFEEEHEDIDWGRTLSPGL